MELKERLVKRNRLKNFGKAVVIEPMVSLLVGLYSLAKDSHQVAPLGWG